MLNQKETHASPFISAVNQIIIFFPSFTWTLNWNQEKRQLFYPNDLATQMRIKHNSGYK